MKLAFESVDSEKQFAFCSVGEHPSVLEWNKNTEKERLELLLELGH